MSEIVSILQWFLWISVQNLERLILHCMFWLFSMIRKDITISSVGNQQTLKVKTPNLQSPLLMAYCGWSEEYSSCLSPTEIILTETQIYFSKRAFFHQEWKSVHQSSSFQCSRNLWITELTATSGARQLPNKNLIHDLLQNVHVHSSHVDTKQAKSGLKRSVAIRDCLCMVHWCEIKENAPPTAIIRGTYR
jgi:hypothetical protein